MEHIVTKKDLRLDNYLGEVLDKSRSKIQEMIESNQIHVNGKIAKASYKVKEEDVISINEVKRAIDVLKAEDIPLDIIYEDDDIIIVNKENKMVVHPAIGNQTGTLVNALLHHSVLSEKESFRPGIVHRIDAQTTGLLVVAKNDRAHEYLANEIATKNVKREYIALVHGKILNDTGTIDAPIGRDLKDRKKMSVIATGKKAITHFKVLERFNDATLIQIELETGRTHQIRVHMQYIEFPIVNDPVYGRKTKYNEFGQCLHAYKLTLTHPTTKNEMTFTAPIPKGMEDIIKFYKGE
jgi:23S rRNA pseudouridine1911/1915/1917 synthase